MKKIVLKLELQDGWEKKKAMKNVSTHSGIDSISMDMKQKKLTVIGVADPITIVTKLRKYWPTTDIILVGPAQELEKPPEKKEEAAKKDEVKKEAAKKEGADRQKEEGKKELGEEAKKEGDGGEEKKRKKKKKKKKKKMKMADVADEYDPVMEMVRAYKAYNPQMPYFHYVQNMEESPSDCNII